MFGIGCSAEIVERKLRPEHRIIGYTDSRAKIKIYKGVPFYELTELRNIKFDYIVITTSSRTVALEIKKILIHYYQIDVEKIIPFCLYADVEIYKIMKTKICQKERIKGIILGNSHARDGLLTDFLSLPFVNLATSSQDIYFNCRLFEICSERYKSELSKLEYIIFDLYDYNSFNIDVSVTDDFFNYLSSGGVLEPHNYNNSKVCKNGFEKDVFDRLQIVTEKPPHIIEVMDKIFIDCSGKLDAAVSDVNMRIKYISKMEPLVAEKCFSGIVTKRYSNTIEENCKILEYFIQCAKRINENIKIIFTLLPRYVTMEKVMKPFMKEWKDEFEFIINGICKKYGTNYINYKNRLDISENNYFYYDVNHLNTAGGISLTSILDEELKTI